MTFIIRNILKTTGPCILILSALWFLPPMSSAEFYRYTDKDGRMVFVDDISKIPPAYLDQIRTYKEQNDNRPEDTKAIQIERNRREEASQEKQNPAEENTRIDRNASNTIQTNVLIDGNKILVPVTIGHTGCQKGQVPSGRWQHD